MDRLGFLQQSAFWVLGIWGIKGRPGIAIVGDMVVGSMLRVVKVH